MNKTKMYLDQYGQKYFASTLKELKEKVCPHTRYPKTSVMYVDKKDGRTVRVGYAISEFWLTEYIPSEREVKND